MRSPTAPLVWPDITALALVLVVAANLHRDAAEARKPLPLLDHTANAETADLRK